MLKGCVGHSATIYHFLIHKNPLEILAEKTFHNFTLRISLTTFAADVTLRFFSALALLSCVARTIFMPVLWCERQATEPFQRCATQKGEPSSESNVMF
jgi:hypothetical protein